MTRSHRPSPPPSDPRPRIRWSEPRPPGAFARLRARAVRWVDACVAGKWWWARAPLLPILVWYLWRHLERFDYAGIYDGLNLALHEAGHALFFWSGSEFLTIAGGTIFELLCPLLAAVVFVRGRDPFGVCVAVFWFGTALLDVSVYAADARARALPLVSLGDGPVGHDWFEMLWRLGALEHDRTIAGAFRGAGLLVLGLSIAGGAAVLARMRRVNDGTTKAPSDAGRTGPSSAGGGT